MLSAPLMNWICIRVVILFLVLKIELQKLIDKVMKKKNAIPDILFIIKKELLVVQASTISIKQAFLSLTGLCYIKEDRP